MGADVKTLDHQPYELELRAAADATVLQHPVNGSMRQNGLMVTCKGLSYTVANAANKKEKLLLLDDVNGFFPPGAMSALMGPSGSGKTTALDILSGRKTAGKIGGEVLFGGVKPTTAFWRRYTGYVEQQDTLIPTLTVEQMIMYTAELKRARDEPLAMKKEVVEKVIKALALGTCRNRLIGDALNRGISGGQAKRVNIAIALVTQPRVLFLDEPSSGLDSWHANEVLTYVKALAMTGITVVATIHSPTAYAFGLFDRMLLLLRGKVAYFGDNGPAVVDYFQSCFPELEGVPEGGNPAEWIVDLTTQADHDGKAADFTDMYKDSQLGKGNLQDLADAIPEHAALDEETQKALRVKRATVTPSWWAFWVLFKYRTLRDWVSVDYIMPRLSDKIIFCFIIFSLFWKLGSGDTTGDWANLSAVLFMWAILPAYGAASYVPALVLERPLYFRERNDGLYRPVTYLCFRVFGEGMLAFVVSLVTATVIWFALQLKGLWVVFWLTYLTTLIFGIVLAYLISALSPNIDVANTALPAYVTVQLFFVGLFIPHDQIPDYWRWFSYLNPLRYAWGSLMKNQFGNCCEAPFLNGKTVLEYYDLDGINSWVWLTIEFAFIVFCFLGTLVALTYVKHQRR